MLKSKEFKNHPLAQIEEVNLNLGSNILMCENCRGTQFNVIANAVKDGENIRAKIIQLECVSPQCNQARGVMQGIVQTAARRIVPDGRKNTN